MIVFVLLITSLIFLFIALIVGLVDPKFVLRWDKKPTKLKVILYWIVLTPSIVLLMGLFGVLTDNKKDYGIITNKINSKVLIDAYYDSDVYNKKSIENLLINITDSLKNEHPNKSVAIFLYPSKKIGEIDRTQWIAQFFYNGDDKTTEVNYEEDKIKALNNRSTDSDYIKLEKLLNERNTSVCDIYIKMYSISKEVLNEANAKYDFNSKQYGEFQEQREHERIIQLLKEYNIPDSLDYKIYAYSIYCK